jgi:hypothetical protein
MQQLVSTVAMASLHQKNSQTLSPVCLLNASRTFPIFKTSETRKETRMSKAKTMSPKAAARIQSAGATKTGGQTAKGSFAARAQSAAAKGSNRSSAKK